MKLKNFFINGRLIDYINSISRLNADWLNSTTQKVVNITELDNYIMMCLGESNILPSVENNVLNNIRTILNVNSYRLNTLWKTTLFNYNPIDNYDRTETQTHNEKIETDNHVTTTDIGERNQTNTNGSYNDTTTTEDRTTAFDSTAYEKPTTKNEVDFTKGASVDSITTDNTTDTVTQNAYTDESSGGYTLHARGNIGTMSTQNMIQQEREVSDFNFYDVIVQLLEKYITCMVYD